MKKIFYFSTIVTISLIIIGLLTFSIFLHEMIHYYDFKEVASGGGICVYPISIEENKLVFFSDSTAGFYFPDEITNKTRYDEIQKYTEYKAYGIQSVIAIILIYFVFYFFWKLEDVIWKNQKKDVKL